jgi:hypothetical protein
MSVRLAGPLDGEQEWLTLFVVSSSGTIYVNWLDRWSWIGLPESVAAKYRGALVAAFGENIEQIPSGHKHAVPLTALAAKWDVFERAARSAARTISAFVAGAGNSRSASAVSGTASAIEGQLTEIRMTRRHRNSRLRLEALRLANGVCAACKTDFSRLLGGRGAAVLQVHHVHQLSSTDAPRLTSVEDLAVVCANCHLLIHSDRDAPMSIAAIRSLWSSRRSNGRRSV